MLETLVLLCPLQNEAFAADKLHTDTKLQVVCSRIETLIEIINHLWILQRCAVPTLPPEAGDLCQFSGVSCGAQLTLVLHTPPLLQGGIHTEAREHDAVYARGALQFVV